MRPKYSWLALICAMGLVMGCTSGPTATTPPVATVEAPTATAAATATPQNTATPEPTAAPQGLVVRIKNANLGTYMYESEGKILQGTPEVSDPASHWLIEDYQGSKRIKNIASGNYIAIEHMKGFTEAIPVEDVWTSPRWTFDSDPAKGLTLIRNVWHNWEVLYTLASNNVVQHGRPPLDITVSQWTLESIDGKPIAEPTATPVVFIPTPYEPEGSRGATVPWIEYEAETGETTGAVIGPDRTFGTMASEASGREAVQLNAVGDYSQFTTQAAANSIVVRYVIPDSAKGDGLNATLSLYVNGTFQQKLNLTSKYAWSYGGESSAFNEPRTGGTHHFYDEARALVKEIPAGATVKLQKDADDTADYYVVDLVDLEEVAPPKTMPNGYLSITTDCGAVPDDGQEDGPAVQKCIDEAKAQHTGVWIPAGTFESTQKAFEVAEVTIQGAGMWYSTFHGDFARFNCDGNNCKYADFAILGETLERNDDLPENGFNNGAGTGSVLDSIWVEHTKVGYWVGPGMTSGLIIRNSRFRNLFADGVNFAAGTSNSLVENSHFRNTGDDALASWSLKAGDTVNTNNLFRFNTVQIPWRANCFAIYGGTSNKVEDNVCADTVVYPGILIAQSFDSTPLLGTTRVQRNTILRGGGPMYQHDHGALKIRAEQGPMGEIVVKDLLVDSATYAGIEVDGTFPISLIEFEDVKVTGSGTQGILIQGAVAGKITLKNVEVSGSVKEGLLNSAPPNKLTVEDKGGNSGW